jgi:hypothetical protein
LGDELVAENIVGRLLSGARLGRKYLMRLLTNVAAALKFERIIISSQVVALVCGSAFGKVPREIVRESSALRVLYVYLHATYTANCNERLIHATCVRKQETNFIKASRVNYTAQLSVAVCEQFCATAAPTRLQRYCVNYANVCGNFTNSLIL